MGPQWVKGTALAFPEKENSMKLKPLAEQVIVITGASSGIGLATARIAADRGARLVLVARSENALRELVTEIRSRGGEAIHVVADVGHEEDVAGITQKAIEAFGGFDTWVNNAGIGVYGKIETVSIEDMRRSFETNFWGQIYGSREAARHLKTRDGGAIINLGSEVSERAVPLQGIYCASKAAVKGFTEALRMELEDEGAPISVTLVKPGQIDTPFTVNARNYLGSEPHHVPPVYAPEAVAHAILRAAVHPVRDVYVGGGARAMAAAGHLAPGLTDRLMQATVIPGTPSGRRPQRAYGASGLDGPTEKLDERGNYEGRVMGSSLYTRAVLHPVLTGALAIGTTLAVRAILRRLPHRAVRMLGRKGYSTEKALHIRLEARRGKEAEVEELLYGILSHVEQEPSTRPWFAVRLSRSVFGIFETFPNNSGRKAHLSGKGAALLMKQSNALLVRPAEISRVDVLATKAG